MTKEFIKVDQSQLDTITEALDGLSYKAPTVMKNAANKVGKVMKDMIDSASQSIYTNEGAPSATIKKEKRATYANPTRILQYVQEGANALRDSDIDPRFPEPWTDPASWVSARVKQASSKDHVTKYGNKAFVATMSSGHTGVFVRTGDGRKITQLMSPSFPQMAGKAYEEVGGETGDMLQDEIQRQIAKVMDRING